MPTVPWQVVTSPDRCQKHHRMLRSYARHDYFEVPKLLQLDPGNVVLDVGAGTGALGTLILQENPKARLVASIQLVPCRLDMSLFLVISRKSAFGAILKASCLRCRSFLHSVFDQETPLPEGESHSA